MRKQPPDVGGVRPNRVGRQSTFEPQVIDEGVEGVAEFATAGCRITTHPRTVAGDGALVKHPLTVSRPRRNRSSSTSGQADVQSSGAGRGSW